MAKESRWKKVLRFKGNAKRRLVCEVDRVAEERGFKGSLVAEKLTKRRWKVKRQFKYIDKYGEEFVIPRAFVTDLASVPRAFWWWFPPDGSYTQAAVLHDYLCEKKILGYERTHEIFKEAMEDLPSVKRRTRNVMGWAVKRFGPRW